MKVRHHTLGILCAALFAACAQPAVPTLSVIAATPTHPPPAALPVPALRDTWYLDADGDGYGSPDDSVWREEQPLGWVALGTDCDDANPTIHPAAYDRCGDALDEDCDGVAASCQELWAADADLTLNGLEGDVYAGYRLGAAGDVNADGYDDAFVSSFEAWGFSTTMGRVYLLHGSADGLAPDGLGLAGAIEIEGTIPTQRLGMYPGAAGDMNADGYPDLALGCPDLDFPEDQNGTVYLMAGPLTADTTPEDAFAVLTSTTPDDHAGDGLAAAGDVDGDGYDDLLVAAFDAQGREGLAYLVPGPISGALSLQSSGFTIANHEARDRPITSAAALGDSDGDGLADLAFGSRRESSEHDEAGAIFIFRGPLYGDQSISDADVVILGEYEDQLLGIAMEGVGDANGDGLGDLLVATRGEYGPLAPEVGGGTWLLLGPFDADSELADAQAHFVNDDEIWTGEDLGAAGDVDGDGRADFLIATDGYGGGPDDPLARLVTGGTQGTYLLSEIGVAFHDGTTQSLDGTVAGVGDVDGDGFSDLMVGSWTNRDSGASAGAAWLFYGHGGF